MSLDPRAIDEALTSLALARGWVDEQTVGRVRSELTHDPRATLASRLVERGALAQEQVDELSRMIRGETDRDGATVIEGLASRGVHAETLDLPRAPAQLPPGPARPGDLAECEADVVGLPARFTRVSWINQGGMGTILRAFQPATGREVALKRLHARLRGRPEQVRKFLAEAQVTAQLEHPAIAPVYDVTLTPDGDLLYAMPLVRGRSLGELVDLWRAGRDAWSIPRRLAVFVRICEALDYAHSRGVLHRDLKPDNVMVGAFGEVLVMDWGLARVEGRPDASADAVAVSAEAFDGIDDGSPLKTQAGSVLGTPAYMPPEQASGRVADIDRRSDVYSLGAILYELLCLEVPHQGATPYEVLVAVAEGEITPPSQRRPDRPVPRELEAIVMKAMAREPRARYQTVAELRADVEAYLEGRLVGAARYSPIEVGWKFLARHKALSAGIAAAIVVVAGLLIQQRVEYGRALAAARTRMQKAVDTEVLEAVARLERRAPEDLRAGRVAPTVDQRRVVSKALQHLARLVATADAVLELDPDDQAARVVWLDGVLATARLAALYGESAVADLAVARARSLRPTPARVEAVAADVERARTRRVEAHAEIVAERLKQARSGTLVGDALIEAVVQLSAFTEPETAAALIAELERTTTQARAAVRDALAGLATPDARERREGWVQLPGLPALVDHWYARFATEDWSTDPAQLGALRTAYARLENRARLRGDDARTYRVLLAEELARRVDKADLAMLPLVCGVLGHLGDSRAARPLARYLWVETDATRAIPAGVALARLARTTPAATDLLEQLLGHRGGARAWVTSGPWWRAVRRLYQPAELAQPTDDSAVSRARAILGRAIARLEAGELELALADCEAAIKLAPRLAQAWSDRAVVRLRLGELNAALEDVDRALELDPNFQKARLNRAAMRMQRGDLEGALEDCDTVLEQYRGSGDAYYQRATIQMRRGDLARARADLESALRLDSRHGGAYMQRGLLREREGDLAGAELDLDRAVELDPSSDEAHGNRGNFYLRKQRDLAKARRDLDRAIELAPRRASHRSNRAGLHMLQGNLDAAQADLDRAVELDPGFGVAFTNRALLNKRRHRIEAALVDFDRALRAREPDAKALIYRAQTYLQLGRLAEARTDLDRACQVLPGDSDAWRIRAKVRRQQGDEAGARADLARAAKLAPGDPGVGIDRADVLIDEGKLVEARALLDKVIAIRPSAELLTRRALVRQRQRDVSGAFEDYRRALRLDDRYTPALIDRASLLTDVGKYGEALQDLNRALALRPRDAAALHTRGNLLVILGQGDKALLDYGQVIALRPQDARGYVGRGQALTALRRFPEAIAAFDDAIARSATLVAAWTSRAEARLGSGDLDGALADVRKAVELAPDQVDPRARRAYVHQARKEYAKAIADYRWALDRAPRDWKMLANLGVCFGRVGKIDEGVAAVQRALTFAPTRMHPQLKRTLDWIRAQKQ